MRENWSTLLRMGSRTSLGRRREDREESTAMERTSVYIKKKNQEGGEKNKAKKAVGGRGCSC